MVCNGAKDCVQGAVKRESADRNRRVTALIPAAPQASWEGDSARIVVAVGAVRARIKGLRYGAASASGGLSAHGTLATR